MPLIVDEYGEKRGSVRKLGNVIRKGVSSGALLQTQEGVDETQGRMWERGTSKMKKYQRRETDQ